MLPKSEAQEEATHPLLLQELLVTRRWDVAEHPEWLVFEVEGGLQIRPVQYDVARKLMLDPGSVVQLNMGEGKTRVILPMLILHWTRAGVDAQRLLRISALTALLHELFDFMHRHLCASVLLRKIFLMPFHRDVKLRPEDIKVMISSMNFCRQSGGVLLVAPEHRLSLLLKGHELRQQGEQEMCRLLSLLADVPVRDLLDESDEVLRHRYQLIYAVGSPMPLPQGLERWETATALLRVLQKSDNVQQLLSTAALIKEFRGPSAFHKMRLIPGQELDQSMPRVRVAILQELLEDPPYELLWLKNYISNASVIRFLTLPEVDATLLPANLPDDRKHVMLALRGFLACSVLEHCMQKRHAVEYGIRRNHAKRLAVPYKASNTPSERSEFGHPDCAILLTLLSYFYDGLNRAELRQAFEVLLAKDESIQKDRYDAWFDLSQQGMAADDRALIESATMIDLSNEQQFASLYKHFHMNFETIAFWVCQCIFPTETFQFPNKLLANAWHLADNRDGLVSGFSGTDDNQRVLPLQVTQRTCAQLLLGSDLCVLHVGMPSWQDWVSGSCS